MEILGNMKQMVAFMLAAGLFCALLTGCGKEGGAAEIEMVTSAANEEGGSKTVSDKNGETGGGLPALYEEMDRMTGETGLEHAVGYDAGMADTVNDQIVLLCKSPSGRFEAYGFITSLYGTRGILINNIIEGQGNYNYFDQPWAYSDDRPSLEESEDFYQVTFTVCQEEGGEMNEILFDTYDTGTMFAEGWEKL